MIRWTVIATQCCLMSGTYLVSWVTGWEWLATPFMFAGLVLLLAGMWEFSNRSTFGAAAFSLYGAIALGLGTLRFLSLFGHSAFADGYSVKKQRRVSPRV